MRASGGTLSFSADTRWVVFEPYGAQQAWRVEARAADVREYLQMRALLDGTPVEHPVLESLVRRWVEAMDHSWRDGADPLAGLAGHLDRRTSHRDLADVVWLHDD